MSTVLSTKTTLRGLLLIRVISVNKLYNCFEIMRTGMPPGNAGSPLTSTMPQNVTCGRPGVLHYNGTPVHSSGNETVVPLSMCVCVCVSSVDWWLQRNSANHWKHELLWESGLHHHSSNLSIFISYRKQNSVSLLKSVYPRLNYSVHFNYSIRIEQKLVIVQFILLFLQFPLQIASLLMIQPIANQKLEF